MGFSVKTFLLLLALLFSTINAFAAIETHEFDNELDRQRYQSFIQEMRCPKCQNQNLAGSDSPISADLRHKIYEMIKLGKSDKEIVDFMVERYGDFILYRPRVTPATYVLWSAPLVILVVGALVLILIIRRRRQLSLEVTSKSLNSDEQARLANLLSSSVTKTESKSDEEPRS
ncbi:cytochrome c-type biogenesis protein CcmH [Cellvibrio zantedeschiae]|uniref:Cytochrome c-type biogenesis protein n=1 Tax=Cellvibrio zantedeschiae TaxID=1237077 RepID=A0ABQ3AY08_9GAMM|nr:cytochrome c-type biogenesis protein [Cellvibrio zantedeschiae]GGY71280.1 cytochrome c-type biogenesis protein CcmH [Cellvibrio zantedeschiae]